MKIEIVSLHIRIITHKKVLATITDPDVEEGHMSGEARLKEPLLAIQCIIKCDELLEIGGIYMDDHAQSWRAYNDTLDGYQLAYLADTANQFWNPNTLTLVQSNQKEGN